MIRLDSEKDLNQHIRSKDFLVPAGVYMILSGLAGLVWYLELGRLSFTILIMALTGVFLTNLFVYAVIQTGLNKRFKDPGLILPQLVLATGWTMVTVYYADQLRSLALIMYLVIFSVGLFRLSFRQLLILSVWATLSYALVIYLLVRFHPDALNMPMDGIAIVLLAMVLPWFSWVGGYVNGLRQTIATSLSTIENLAIIDELTQVFNQRQMENILEQQKALADRGIHPFALCVFALDQITDIQETYGINASHGVLKIVAQKVHQNLRDIDHIARYTEETFAIILPNSGSREAMVCAKRIRQMVRDHAFSSIPPHVRMTLSVGVTKYQPSETIQDVVDRADKALLAAKAHGRDRVEYEPVMPVKNPTNLP